METTSSVCSLGDPTWTVLEEKRQRRRAKNKAKKEDLKRAREEEIRRKLYEPKNQRVRLVHRKELEAFHGHCHTEENSTAFALPVSVKPEDFPDLGASKYKPKTDKKARNKVPVFDSCLSATEVSSKNDEGTSCDSGVDPNTQNDRNVALQLQCQSEEHVKAEHTSNEISAKSSSLKPKRADPIKVNLLSVLKKPPTTGEKKMPSTLPKKKVPSQLSGNQLDSSKPERKRGKMRENPKPQKPSHLKSVILQDRQARKALQSQLVAHSESTGTGRDTAIVSSSEVPLRVITNNCQASETDSVQETDDSRTLDLCESSLTSDRTLDKVVSSKENVLCSEVVCSQEIVENMNALKIGENKVMHSIHSRKFRDYCDHMPSCELDTAVSALISDIVRYQDRLYFSDPVKAHAKRRFVLGFRETRKYLLLKKLKLVVIAPDLETARSKGGIDDTVAELKDLAHSQGVLCIFSIGRSVLRRLTNKSCAVKGISCVGVLNFEGSQDNYHTIQNLLPELRNQYQCLAKDCSSTTLPQPVNESEDIETKETEEELIDVNKQVVATFLVKLTKELENK